MKEIQIPRKEIQIFRNEIQAEAEQNPNPAERNPNSHHSVSFAFSETCAKPTQHSQLPRPVRFRSVQGKGRRPVIASREAAWRSRRTKGARRSPDRGGEGFRLPSLRTARAVFPHTALRLTVSSSGVSRLPQGGFEGEEPRGCEEGVFPPLTPFPSADTIRSLHTEPSTHDQSRVSAPCLAPRTVGAGMASSGPSASIFLPRLPSGWFCFPSFLAPVLCGL
jgi:hypothetical protein